MKTNLLIPQLFPRAHARFVALPLFGSQLEEFVQWLGARGYTRLSLRNHLKAIRPLERWLRRHGKRALTEVTATDLRGAHERFRTDSNVGGAVRALRTFLHERGRIAAESPPPLSCSGRELIAFGSYLQQSRGFADRTVVGHQRRLRFFLQHVGCDRRPSILHRLRLRQIETFVQHAARRNNRFSLQHIVATVRAYLRWLHTQGRLNARLHEQIDTPRVYRLEQLPRAVPWAQVTALLRSIDCSRPSGRRDFTILYLAVRYGLRSAELVRLRLDDLDWRAGTLCVRQTKTKQALVLPLTDEAGDLLARYLRDGRPSSRYRELFLRQRAPSGPLQPTAIHDILEHHIARSGLALPPIGSHALRHSFAVHLLRQGVSPKSIGDVLGHRDVESTSVYLRLAVEELRHVGLPLPRLGRASGLVSADWRQRLPKARAVVAAPLRRKHWGSAFAASLRRYLELRRALGRRYAGEEAVLRRWDDFLARRRVKMRQFNGGVFRLWADSLARLTPTVRRNHLRIVRNFLLFHRRGDSQTWIPDPVLFPRRTPHRPPRLVTPHEMGRVLAAAARLPGTWYNPLRAATVALALALLFCCGLRRGELLRLRLCDYDSASRTLRIDETKFHKSRLVPLPASVARHLHRYLKRRQRHRLPMAPESPLIWSGRRSHPHDGYTGIGLNHCWQQLCVSVAVLDERGRPPRLHDLRHSFAVAALQRWYAAGHDPQAKLPHLATYLGHLSPVSTHHYLHLTPGLRAAAGQRFHSCFASLFSQGGAA